MKKYCLFFAMSIVIFLCSSCKKNEPILPPAYARMVIIKFNHPELLDKVIFQHPIKKYDGINGCFEYDTTIGLSLNVLAHSYVHNYSLSPSVVTWIEEEMHLAGSSPYIPLSEGYYLIDWKWHHLLPLSALSDVLPNTYHNPLEEHIRSHCFLTDIDWTDLQDLNAEYDKSLYSQSLDGVETKRVLFRAIDQFYNDIKLTDPYMCWNMSLYSDGLSIENAYKYYCYGACDEDSGKSYRTYINYCDSLQGVYQKRLIEIINQGQLNKFVHL